MSHSSVVGAEHNAARRNPDTREHGSGNVAGIDVAGVRCDATDGPHRFWPRRQIRDNIGPQFFRVCRIEAAGNCRFAQAGHGCLLQECREFRGWVCSRDANSRNRAALWSSDRASARIEGWTFALFMAPVRSSAAYRTLRLFHSVLRFWAKESFRKLTNSPSFTPSFSRRGTRTRRTTADCTLGGGEKDPGETSKSFSTRPYN